MTDGGERKLRILLLCGVGFLCTAAFAQPLSLAARSTKGWEGAAQTPAHIIRADVNLVLVPTVVTDRKGATVIGLTRNNFTVLDNKVPQAREKVAALYDALQARREGC